MSNLTEDEKNVLSNTICGDPEVVGSLMKKGYVHNVREDDEYDDVLFFRLTEKGEEYHQKHFQIET